MSSKKSKGKSSTNKKRAQRATTNVFALFDQTQIQEFKEAFNMIDQNRDGFIDKEDLHDMMASMGRRIADDELDAMINEATGPINFTLFLTMFGEKLTGTDHEEVIKNAFAVFDEQNSGFIKDSKLRELLMTTGERFTLEETEETMSSAPCNNGFFDYVTFTHTIKHGNTNEED